MTLKIIEHNSNEYAQMVDLRMQVLRIPLGLSFTKEDLAKEKNDILIAAFENNALMGCCVLTQRDEATLQLRQMAVAPQQQKTGIGTAILQFAEKVAAQKGYTVLMMHARNIALPFYEKCGYTKTGNAFIEVTIPHYKMEKKLQ